MVIAEVGLGDLLWTAVWVFFLVTFVWVFVAVLGDLFRDHTLSGGAKALWVLGLIVFPVVGSLVYLVVRGEGMAQRAAARERHAQQVAQARAAETVAAEPVDTLVRLDDLRTRGALTDEEYDRVKRRVVERAAA